MSLPPSLLSIQPLLGSLPVSMIATDLDGVVLAWNTHAERMYGWSAEEAMGRPLADLGLARHNQQARDSILQQLLSGRPWEGETTVRRHDGCEVTIHAVDSPLFDESGAVTGILGLAVDVTAERLGPIAMLEAVIKNTGTSVTVVGEGDRVLRTLDDTPSPRDGPSRFAGMHLSEIVPDPSLMTMVRSARTSGSARGLVEFKGRTYDSSAVALPEAVAGPGGMAIVATDITERVAESRRFQALVENTQDALSILDRDGGVRYVSPAVERIVGYTSDEVMGMPRWSAIHPEDVAAVTRALNSVRERANAVVTYTYRVRHRDGTWRHIELTAVNRLDDPAIQGIVAAAHDVTERYAADQRLLALNRMHRVLSETGQAMVRATDPIQLLADACRILVDTGDFAAAAFTTPASSDGEVVVLAHCQGATMDGTDPDTTAAIAEAVRTSGVAPEAYPLDWLPGDHDPLARSGPIALFPVVPREGSRGVLAVCAPSGEARLTAEAGEMLRDMAREVAFALDSLTIDRARAEATALSDRRAQQQSIVSELGVLAIGVAGTGHIIDAAVAALAEAHFGLRQITVYELMPEGNEVLVRAVAGSDVPVVRGDLIARRLVPVASDVLDCGETLTVSDMSCDPRFVVPAESPFLAVGSLLCVPVRVGGETLAALVAHSFAADDFDGRDSDFYESVAHVISRAMERSRYETSIRHDAMHDRLTGLPNRELFQDRLAQALFRRRRGQVGPLAVLVADLDGFKRVNDSFGHDAGDRLLGLAAARLRDAVRPSDTVARLGGDEFVILCEDLAEAGEATTVATRIIERIRDPYQLDGRELSLTASIGIAASSDDATVEGLLRDADVAMYRAKETGRSRYELVDDALRGRQVQRLDIEQGLRHALERQELAAAYQPIIDLVTGGVREAEALLRWTREDGTPVAPAEFIPIAEQTGMIGAIGDWVLFRACEDAVRWNQQLAPAGALGVAVNISARQISDPALVPTVVRALQTTGLAPDLLRLEITETALMEEGAGAVETLQALDGLGVRLSVDDFGTGYSSLMYLRQYPVRVLKIDRYFVAGLGKNREDDAIVEGIIALAHSLGLSATAEGVETTDQLARLRLLQCDSAQGYLWSKAVTFDAFVPLVEDIRAALGDPVAAPVAVPLAVRPAGDVVGEISARRRRVVIADDSPSDRGLLRIALQQSGRFIVAGEASDGEGAIALAAERQPDLLVLDMSMPGMNGLEALGPIHRASPGTVVVFLSGFLSGALAEAVTQAGAFAQFDKSLPMDSLVTRLAAMCQDGSGPLAMQSTG